MDVKLYPETQPYDAGFVATGDGHELYYERHGNRDAAEKIIYLHGGPGVGCNYREYRWFDPGHFDILLFDQRWAPKSRPDSGSGANGMDIGIADVEKMRRYFGCDIMSIVGGSYGSALAMLYAARHPDRVRRLLLRGIFFADPAGADFLLEENGAAALLSPNKGYEDVLDFIPAAERAGGLRAPYRRRITGADKAVALEAARRLSLWNTACATAVPRQDMLDETAGQPEQNLKDWKIWFHFLDHDFSPARKAEMLEGMARLPVPVDIVHGRQDYVCSVRNAVELDAVCRQSQLNIIENCGHSMKEPALQAAYIDVTNRWRQEDRSAASPG